jgi:hypothetical protein
MTALGDLDRARIADLHAPELAVSVSPRARSSPSGPHTKRIGTPTQLAFMGSEEDDMSGTLTTACPLCGLRYADRRLLELHIREDHLQRNRGTEPDHEESGDAGHPSSVAIPAARPGLRAAFHHEQGDGNDNDAAARPLTFRIGDDHPALGDPHSAVHQRGAGTRIGSHFMLCSHRNPPAGGRSRRKDARAASTTERADRAAWTRRQSPVQPGMAAGPGGRSRGRR